MIAADIDCAVHHDSCGFLGTWALHLLVSWRIRVRLLDKEDTCVLRAIFRGCGCCMRVSHAKMEWMRAAARVDRIRAAIGEWDGTMV